MNNANDARVPTQLTTESQIEDGADSDSIMRFTHEHAFLSNFWICPAGIKYEGITFPTVEHAYQSAKTLNMASRLRIKKLDSAAEAKKAGKEVVMRDGWEDMKLEVMSELLQLKFQDPELRDLLLATGERQLVEGVWWKDLFWGVYQGREPALRGLGANWLGVLLMSVRESLR